MKTKIIIICAGIWLLSVVGVWGYQKWNIRQLNKTHDQTIVELTRQIEEARQETATVKEILKIEQGNTAQCEAALSISNAEIKRYELEVAKKEAQYYIELQQLENKYNELKKEYQQFPTCEAQLANILQQQLRWYHENIN